MIQDKKTETPEMSVAEYDQGWETKWDDMKKFGPFSRHVRRLILSIIRPLKFQSVLDVGCGQGSLLSDLCAEFPQIIPYGVDFSDAAVKIAQARLPHGQFRTLDLTKESMDQKFDLTICSEVLEHISDDTRAIKNLAAMTGKYLVITTPQGRMREFEIKFAGHVRNYAYGELVRKLSDAGLKTTRVIEWGFPFYSPLYRNWLNLSSGGGTTGEFGPMRKLLTSFIYNLFLLNSWSRGDEIVTLSEPQQA